MIAKFSNHITILAQSSKLLIIGEINKQISQLSDTYFKEKEHIKFTEDTLDLLNDNIYNQYDVIVFSLSHSELKRFKSKSNFFPKNSILIIDSNTFSSVQEYINNIFSLCILPISDHLLMDKIYNILCIDESSRIIQAKEKIVMLYKDDDVNTNISEFLDKYHGTILFLNDDLNNDYKRLNDLEISKELFASISSNIIKLNNVLKNHKSFDKVFMTFSHLSDFLINLELESIEPTNYSAFDYLCTIIKDVIVYLDELFIYNLFKDLRVFEDSLENNVKFFVDSLTNELVDDSDNLEFF